MPDLPLHLVGSTATKITLGWTPVAGAVGYRFQSAGTAPKWSHTWDPTRSQVTFAKGQEPYLVEALGVSAQGSWPAVTPPPAEEPKPIAGQGYREVFRDDFDTLDTQKWSLNMWYESGPRTGQIRTAGGVLELRAGASGPNVSICTDAHGGNGAGRSFLYGYFEMRAKWTWKTPGAWPALWLLSQKNRDGQNAASPPTSLASEFDIFEGYHQGLHSPFTGALHRNTSSLNGVPDQVKACFADPVQDYDTQWHTYAGLWTPDRISWFFDERELKRETPWDSTDQQMFLIIDLWLTQQPPSGDALLQVDWVKGWQK